MDAPDEALTAMRRRIELDGSGLAPLMAMIRLRAAVGSGVETKLLASSRGWEDVIYRAELERLAGDGLTVVHTLTASRPPGWTGYARQVDADMLAEVGPGPAAQLHVFVCGPTSFVDTVAGMLQDVIAVETTTTVATCGGCGEPTPMGETHVYRGAGFVLRCARCENALVTRVRGDTRMWIGFPGIRTLQISLDPS